jgi:hypothetical protein
VKVWELSNEIEGAWHMARQNAADCASSYSRGAKAMRRADGKIELAASGTPYFRREID